MAPPGNFSDLFSRGLATAIINLRMINGQAGNIGQSHRQTEAETSFRRYEPCQVLMSPE
jgi:hypothetical protein